MQSSHISFAKAGFSQLITDYFTSKPELKAFYKYTPNLNSFKDVIEDKSRENIDRKTLVSVLKSQYAKLKNIDIPVTNNIELLLDTNTFTVTTGHQLNLFTGPLYFIYKIITTINLAEELSKKYTDKNIVPVYWMATEDHDFEEINHINIYNKPIVWNQPIAGATGKIRTNTLANLLQELKTIIGEQPNAIDLYVIIEKAYTVNDNLADATRYLVNALFGKYGLIVIDADNVALKKEFIDIVKEDILKQSHFEIVNKTTEQYKSNNYKAQISPREINVFYLGNGFRERIVKTDKGFNVLNTEIVFTENELVNELNTHPEKFSPNVVLRPLYQEKILPNLAYVGGSAEVGYWMQLIDIFKQHQINFPVLMLRNCMLWIDEAQQKRMQKLGITADELFMNTDALIKKYIQQNTIEDISLASQKQEIEKLFNAILDKAFAIDATLKASIEGEKQKQLSSIQLIEDKMLKAQKKKYETDLQQIKGLKEKLFPNDGLQERTDNMIPYYVKYGTDFIENLKNNFNPFDKAFLVLLEEVKLKTEA
jgi:bacillithiol biosynthesis cysteine-adding enzyme BshC